MLFYSLLTTLESEERSCVEKIFNQYHKLIFEIGYSILHHTQDAEDNVDVVMINVIKNVGRFTNADKKVIESQLVIYTRNAAINIYNKNKRREKLFQAYTYVNEEGDLEEIPLVDESKGTEELVISQESADILKKYIKMLPHDYQDVLKLVYHLGYTNIEVAHAMSITQNAANLKLHRAKKRLFKFAEGELHDRVI